jgi:peptidase C25-like protein
VKAQQVAVDVEWRAGGGADVQFAIEWSRTLSQTVDSLNLAVINVSDLPRVGYGLTQVDYLAHLGSLSLPGVSVVASSYDELSLPPGASMDDTPRRASGATAQGLGMYRKRPVASVTAPVVTYDAGSQLLRRYNHLTIRIRGAARPAARASGSADMNPHVAVTESVLAGGSVFRIPITEEGIYRIDRDLLSALGLNPDSVEPDNLQLFGNGGRPVPALNSTPRLADLAENPVFVRGGGDGRFDSGDVLLFYAAGPVSWEWGPSEWEHTVNPFSTENAYFLKLGSAAGLRVGSTPFVDAAGMPVLTDVTGRFVLDYEEQAWSREHGSGRDWMSNTIRAGSSRQILENVELPELVGGVAEFRIRAAIASNPRATLNFEMGGQIQAQRIAPRVVVSRAEAPSAIPLLATFSTSLAPGPVSLTMRLLNQINEPQAAADYVQVFYRKALDGSSGYIRVASPAEMSGPLALGFSGFGSQPFVWDVTEPDEIRGLGVRDFAGSARVRVDRAEGTKPRELVAFVETAARPLSSDLIAPVPNQNLHGIAGFPDLAIITPPDFLEAAEELAEMRRADGLTVVVAQTSEIYNEFSGGIPDMRAVRDYFRFLYDRAPTDDVRLRYGLMFGDGHYDFRELAAREGSLKNWVFPYETEETLDTDASFTSDDYFGFLDPNEGIWRYTSYIGTSEERVDIGIGRFPVQTLAEARSVVDKIRRYESPETFGSWRTGYTFVADDGPTGLSGQQDDADLHLQNVDGVAELIRGGVFPAINVQKIYAESFDRVFLNGFRVPGARRAILASLESGTLLWNYSGHGGPTGLAQEELFTLEDAEALSNRDKLAVVVTATCSFGWWDLQEFQSGAEAMLLNPDGGAVALLTTVRLVFTSGSTTSLNAGLNRALNVELFRSDNGKPRRLGDAMRATKNTAVGLQGNSRKFNLLGDPTMRLGLPARDVEIESINGVDLAAQDGRMSALDRVTIQGAVKDAFGQTDPTFEGQVSVTVFDALRKVPILKQRFMATPFYRLREDLIWRGKAEATAGEWSATFVVPKDISYSNQAGRVSAYAVSASEQGLGYSEAFDVGGTSDNPPDDGIGPEMRLFLNDTTFVSGDTASPDTELIVKFFDESGINTVGAGVGHEMLLVVNGGESNAVDIGGAFTSEANSFQRGEVRWPVTFDQTGPGTLSVRAWDVLNNSGSAQLEYVVAEDEVLRLRNVYNYPNPMNRLTRFVFEHNQPAGTSARVSVRVYTINGTPIRTIETEEALPGGILTTGPVQILWDGMDDDLDRLATGIYLYQLRVEVDHADGTMQSSEVIEKLAVIR